VASVWYLGEVVPRVVVPWLSLLPSRPRPAGAAGVGAAGAATARSDGAATADDPAIAEAVRVLRGGGLVAFPTETVYGLGARALDPSAIARVFAAKGRPARHPLIAHVMDETGARALAAAWPYAASILARAFWPGPLTIVVPRAPHVPGAIAGGADSVAVRAPAHPVARAILAALGEPLAAPSANRYQSLSPVTAAHVVKSLGDAVDLVVDGGPTTEGIESTVVDVRGGDVVVLRPGAIDLAALRAVVPARLHHAEPPADGEGRASPGMDARHYAPRAALILAGAGDAERAAIDARARPGKDGAPAKVALVVRAEPSAAIDASFVVHVLPADAKGYERSLFATLHAADDAGCDVVVVEAVPDGDAWLAARDRLARARA